MRSGSRRRRGPCFAFLHPPKQPRQSRRPDSHRSQGGSQGCGTDRFAALDEGQVYRCRIALLDDGRKLQVRGFIGIPLLGRSQTWVRKE
ncbi:MAG: DUF2147 domain-containing protein [Betaproteobacteria bacterium]|nr:MAG: DUF2147 domain-containing protein [Betaproteobacteria bacterium]